MADNAHSVKLEGVNYALEGDFVLVGFDDVFSITVAFKSRYPNNPDNGHVELTTVQAVRVYEALKAWLFS